MSTASEDNMSEISEIKRESLNHLPNPPEYRGLSPDYSLSESEFERLVDIDSDLTIILADYIHAFSWYDPDDTTMNTPDVEIVDSVVEGNIAESCGTKISIQDTSTAYHRFVALAHEYGHVLLCHSSRDISTVTEEVEAELVAYLFTSGCDIPCPQSSAYIAKYIRRLDNSEGGFNDYRLSPLPQGARRSRASREGIQPYAILNQHIQI